MTSKEKHLYPTPWSLMLALWGFWIALTGSLNPIQTLLGGVLAYGVARFSASFTLTKADLPALSWGNLGRGLLYIGLLLVEIIKANIQVVRIVLDPRLPISPQYIRIPLRLKTAFNQTAWANSITITPGTLTIAIDEDGILVHALTEDMGASLVESALEERLHELEVRDDGDRHVRGHRTTTG